MVINQACVYWDELRLENVKYHEEVAIPDERILISGDILLNSTGTGTLGRAVIFVDEAKKRYVADTHVTVIRTDAKQILPEYLTSFLSLPDTQEYIYTGCVNGSTNQIELSKEAFSKMPVPAPCLEKQKTFVELKRQSDKSKLTIENSTNNQEEAECLQKLILKKWSARP